MNGPVPVMWNWYWSPHFFTAAGERMLTLSVVHMFRNPAQGELNRILTVESLTTTVSL